MYNPTNANSPEMAELYAPPAKNVFEFSSINALPLSQFPVTDREKNST
jgi:hypothetical protein